MNAIRIAYGLALTLLVAQVAAAQSLGEVARQEAERRKAIVSSGKVFTNENLRTQPAPAVVAAPAAPAAAAPAAAGQAPTQVAPSPSGTPPAAPGQPATPAPAASAEGARDEASWRQRMTAEREALARAQIFADALQSRINALATDFAARSDPAQRAVISGDRQKALAELDRVKQEIAQHQKAIATIQDEARRAGVPAGWVR